MSEPARRLGRGLHSLLSPSGTASKLADRIETLDGQAPSKAGSARYRTMVIALDAIRPNQNQPRREVSDAGIAQLASSIRENGLIQPVVVRPSTEPGAYQLIAGERRWRAARAAGLSDVPAIVRHANDQQLLELALVENIQREDLNAIDRALAYRQFRERFGLTAEQIGERVGEDRTTVTNYLRLLELPENIQQLVAGELITMGHARALLGVSSPDLQLKLAKAVVTENLSVRALEDLVRGQRPPRSATARGGSREDHKRAHIRDLEQQFTATLHTRVLIQEGRKKHHGRIVIEYYSLDDFQRIAECLGMAGNE